MNLEESLIVKSEENQFYELSKIFDSYEEFYNFLRIMITIPTIKQINKLSESDINIYLFEFLESKSYFKILSFQQKFNLFKEACSNKSIDIAILIFANLVNFKEIEQINQIKDYIINNLLNSKDYLKFIIFKKIWDTDIILFNQEENEKIFLLILKSSNIEFIKWFISLNIINFKEERIKQLIGWEVLENIDDFNVAIFICSLYIN